MGVSGIGGVVKRARPQARVVGVQVDSCASFPASLAAHAPVTFEARATIAVILLVFTGLVMTLYLRTMRGLARRSGLA